MLREVKYAAVGERLATQVMQLSWDQGYPSSTRAKLSWFPNSKYYLLFILRKSKL